MLEDLDKSLEQLLKQELPQTLVDQVTITFATPDGQFPPSSVSLPALDLFLYDVRENVRRRTNEGEESRGENGSLRQSRPAVRVDCSYLITAWPSESAPSPPRDEHRLLGELMKVLLRHRTLPSEVLTGKLVGQTPAIRTTALQPPHLQSIGEFWQALGGKPKPALHYVVTLSMNPFEPMDVVTVLESTIRLREEE